MITNHNNLPEALVRALSKGDTYDPGHSDATVSSLHNPPRVNLLKAENKGELTEDVSEMINRALGTAFHKLMEESAVAGDTVEHRFYANVRGWIIGGQVDLFNEQTGHLVDWKVLSVWSVVVGDAVADYTNKMNTYAEILRFNGHEVNRLSIVVLFRDWNAREARSNPDYPQAQVVEYDLPLWEPARAKQYIYDLVARHQDARQMLDTEGVLVECSDEDKWAKPTTYAVKKDGNIRALRVFKTADEAIALASEKGKGHTVETRPGEYTRCMHYCPVREVCPIGRDLQSQAALS